MIARLIFGVGCFALLYYMFITTSSCAVIVPPTGGARDSIAPKLVSATPSDKATNVSSRTITLQFDEFVDLEDAYTRITVSPQPRISPEISKRLKTVTIKLKDSLEPNTTYQVAVNGAIKDVNEGNKLNDFSFVFSTGNVIDSNTISGKAVLAETGKVDSTLIAALYVKTTDSTIAKTTPRYVTKLRGDGSFQFKNLPPKKFELIVLQNEGGQRKYTNPEQLIAFNKSEIDAATNPSDINMYIFAQEKAAPKSSAERADTKIKLSNNLSGGQYDILKPLTITSNKKLIDFNATKITLLDSGGKQLNTVVSLDSIGKNITINSQWKLGTRYQLVVNKDFATDEKKQTLSKNDTLKFETKAATDYGKVVIRFSNIELSNNPVLLIKQGDNLIQSIPLKAFKIYIERLLPAEYDLYILYDTNRNGRWDAGNYWKKIQTEIVKPINKKLSVKANWDNDLEIEEKL